MYHSKLGYPVIPSSVIAMRSALLLRDSFAAEALDFAILDALVMVADIKSFVTSIKVPQFLQIGGSSHFAPGTAANAALYRLLLLNFQDEKLFDGTYEYRVYRTDPYVTIDEMVENVVASRIRYMSLNDDLSGDKTLWGAYIAEFVEWVQNVVRIANDEAEIVPRLLRYRQHIVYKLSKNIALEPAEKTFILHYYPGSPLAPVDWVAPVTAKENEDLLVNRDFTATVSAYETGPIKKYFKMVSNRSLEQLVAVILPGVTSLPVNVGSFIPRGTMSECDFTPLANVGYSDTLEVDGVRERIRLPEVGLKDVVQEGDVKNGSFKARLTPSMPGTIKSSYPIFGDLFPGNKGKTSFGRSLAGARSGPLVAGLGPIPFDFDEISLELRSDSMQPKDPYSGLRASWNSTWRGRRVNTDNGATLGDFLTDLALDNATYGSGVPLELMLPDGGVIDNSEPSIQGRVMSFGTITGGAISPVMYRVYFLRNAQLEMHDVDMRFYYARRGTTLIKPAFAEFIHPPKSMVFNKQEAAVAFLVGELGLTEEEAKLNELALTICFNYEEIGRLFDGNYPPIKNVQQFIKTMLSI
jgi:hypothetical protein